MTRSPLRVAIVDDEVPARALLREYLAAESDLVVAAECENGFEAVKTISEIKPDIVLLDIQMPKLNGFEVLELLDPGPLVIFCTAYDEYAIRAFEVHAVDYLLKPFSRERLHEALEKAIARLDAGQIAGPTPARIASDARPPGRFTERILVKDGTHVHVIPAGKVDFLEAQDDYVAVHSEGRSWLKTQTLSDLATGLDPDRFVRIHRSYVVNIGSLSRIEQHGKDSRLAILASGRELPVSRSGYNRLKELL